MSDQFTREQKERMFVNMGYDIFDRIPDGYMPLAGAETHHPLGLSWYTNGKSFESGERKNILVRYPEPEEGSKNE